MNTKCIAISAAVLTLLVGCGGGGGGGTSTPATSGAGTGGVSTTGGAGSGGTSGTTTGTTASGTDTTVGAGGTSGTAPSTTTTSTSTGPIVKIEPVISKLYQNGQFFAKQDNVVGADTYGVTVQYTHAPDSTFEGNATATETIKRDVTKNGAPFSSTTQTDYFKTSPTFTMLGRYVPSQSPATYYVAIASSQVPLPATGKPGDSGDFYSSTIYDSPSKAVTIGTSKQTWKITADTDTSVLFCINSVTTVNPTRTTQECYKITTSDEIKSNLFTISN